MYIYIYFYLFIYIYEIYGFHSCQLIFRPNLPVQRAQRHDLEHLYHILQYTCTKGSLTAATLLHFRVDGSKVLTYMENGLVV